jgi:enoyl-CoA hydratase/carnithine racemase
MTTPLVLLDVEDGIATLRLHNPLRRNAISASMWRLLRAMAGELGARGDVRAVLVRGEGSAAFSAGADISDFAAARAGTDQAQQYDDMVEQACRAFEAITQPTVAMVHGACIGAGASLAASCDLIVAADDAFFAVPAARLGLGYDVRGVARFLRVCGIQATRELLYTGQRMAAARAHQLGMVQTLAPAAQLEQQSYALARTIAANAPLTVQAAKVAIRAHTGGAGGAAGLLELAQSLAGAADASADYAEGRLAFAEKRAPRFQGS